MPVSTCAAGEHATALSRLHSSGLSGIFEKSAVTLGSIALCASRRAGESETDCRCVTLPHAKFNSSVAFSNARNVDSYVSWSDARDAIASTAAWARASETSMSGTMHSGVCADQRTAKAGSRKGEVDMSG